MLFSVVPSLEKRKEADILLIPYWKKGDRPKNCSLLDKVDQMVKMPLSLGDFTGKEKELLFCYLDKAKEKRALLLGLGEEEKITVEVFRKCFGEAARACSKKGFSHINLLMPALSQLRGMSADEVIKGICEGILLANYRFEVKSEKKEDKSKLLKSVELIGLLPKEMKKIADLEEIAGAIYFARDLINGNADLITPDFLAKEAKEVAKKLPSIHTTVLDRKQIEKEGMGLFLAVAKGSSYDPAFIIMRYEGAERSKDHTLFIGKGLTFDSGGLNLKPTGSIETMRCDMAGAAAVFGLMIALATLKLKVNVTGVIAACENAIDAKSVKPGDVARGYSGKTVEIGNTDAEGRLTLADAISYCVANLKPTRIIDIATLTGAISVAIGDEIAGLFVNDDLLAQQLTDAGEKTGELLWRFPLYAPYLEEYKSDIADLKNSGGRGASAIKGALFLQEFVEKTPWAHLDIGGTAFSSKESGYLPKNGVGFGVRLALEFLSKLAK